MKLLRLVPLLGLLALAGCGSAAAPAAPPATASAADNVVLLSEWAVSAPSAHVAPGKYTYNIQNTGKTPHELLVFKSDLTPAPYPMSPDKFNEEGAGITKVSDGDNIDPGKSQTRTVDLTVPGTYLFTCNLPGPFKAGMFETVTVQ